MSAKWIDEYRKNYLETRFVSQLAAFLISLFSLLSLYSSLRAGYFFPEYVKNNWQFWIPIAFHVFVALIFGVRFVLLFFSLKKSFWFSQLFWFLDLIVLFAWSCYTEHSFYGFFHESFQVSHGATAPSFSEAPDGNFIDASHSLSILGSTYFFLVQFDSFLQL